MRDSFEKSLKNMCCVICGEGRSKGGAVRLNPPGEMGLWACLEHKSLFETVMPTNEVLKHIASIRLKRRN